MEPCQLCKKKLCSGSHFSSLSDTEKEMHVAVTNNLHPYVCKQMNHPDKQCDHCICNLCMRQKIKEVVLDEGKGVASHGRSRRRAAPVAATPSKSA